MSKSRLLITGPGRSGTSFLIQLFTVLGLDTGFDPNVPFINERVRAGGEWIEYKDANSIEELKEIFEKAPAIIKNPALPILLKDLLFGKFLNINHCIIPVRDHREAASSRLGRGLGWSWAENTEASQVMANDIMLGRSVEACILADIPITFLKFPRLVKDVTYCHYKLIEPLKSIGIQITSNRFEEVYNIVADPKKIKYCNFVYKFDFDLFRKVLGKCWAGEKC